ncbi:ABC transporter permease [Bacillus sp. WP8]|uniref:ABC transporter permease n=1 Tax=Bacillus sp. WP8 TaxID=756828 RepID=UPI0037BE40D2
MQQTTKYLKYIFNHHLLILLIFFLPPRPTSYTSSLKHIPPHFPSYSLIPLLFSLLLTTSYLPTLIKQPHLLFFLTQQ